MWLLRDITSAVYKQLSGHGVTICVSNCERKHGVFVCSGSMVSIISNIESRNAIASTLAFVSAILKKEMNINIRIEKYFFMIVCFVLSDA